MLPSARDVFCLSAPFCCQYVVAKAQLGATALILGERYELRALFRSWPELYAPSSDIPRLVTRTTVESTLTCTSPYAFVSSRGETPYERYDAREISCDHLGPWPAISCRFLRGYLVPGVAIGLESWII